MLEQMILRGQGSKMLKDWSHPPESNRRPTDYESVALPTELGWHPNKNHGSSLVCGELTDATVAKFIAKSTSKKRRSFGF